MLGSNPRQFQSPKHLAAPGEGHVSRDNFAGGLIWPDLSAYMADDYKDEALDKRVGENENKQRLTALRLPIEIHIL